MNLDQIINKIQINLNIYNTINQILTRDDPIWEQ